jgi:hypothetical protein
VSLCTVELRHTDKKPKTTIIVVDGVELFEIRSNAADLHFIQPKISNSNGKDNSGEYLFDVEWRSSHG